MTASAGPALRDLHRRYADHVNFVSLYVREAHPGNRYEQAHSLEQKLGYARDYQRRDSIPWTVAVDDVEGLLHRQLDPKPHSAYLVASDGTVAFRSLWANDADVLEEALSAVAAGHRPDPPQRETRLVPMLRGTGCMWESWKRAGGHAKTDVLRQAPPVYLSGRVADLVPGPPLARGVVGNLALMAPMIAGGAYLMRRRRKRRAAVEATTGRQLVPPWG